MTALNFSNFEARLTRRAPPPQGELMPTYARDGVELACRLYRNAQDFNGLLIFYHGGGANMRAGYDRLAAELVRRAPLAVCLTDMRGHGESGGRRGHAPSPEAVWQDVDSVAAHLLEAFPSVALHLGGHSSGAGMLLNYCTRHDREADPRSLVLLAPEFGHRARLRRAPGGAGESFSQARRWPFILNALSGGGLAGDIWAVRLNYGHSRLADELGCISSYTVNMALAVTPNDPAGQLARLDLPGWVGVAGADELIDPQKLEAFLATNAQPALERQLIPGATHLGVILDAAEPILKALGFGAA